MLDYIDLGILVFVGITIFYGIIAIHDIPYEIAKHRNHPQQDAIHVAGWVSLFTIHVLWPFLWIWATLYREDRGWGFSDEASSGKHVKSMMPALSEGQIKPGGELIRPAVAPKLAGRTNTVRLTAWPVTAKTPSTN